MSRPVVPIALLARRIVEHGRIRLGVQGDRGPRSIDTFRFTSPDKEAIETIGERYGGTVKPWSPKKGRNEFEVISEASSIPIALPPEPLGNTPIYELWSAGGVQRRCDGEQVEVPTRTPDGLEMIEQDCICAAKGRMDCKPITRLRVILPELKFAGTWRVETGSWDAAHELPGMVEVVRALQGKGLMRALLAIDKRTEVKDGKTRHFNVPILRLDDSLDDLERGTALMPGLAPGPAKELEAGEVRAHEAHMEARYHDAQAEADVIDAEVIEDAEVIDADMNSPMRFNILRKAATLRLSGDDIMGFVFVVSEGETENMADLSNAQLDRIVAVLQKMDEGKLIYKGKDQKRAVVAKAGQEEA